MRGMLSLLTGLASGSTAGQEQAAEEARRNALTGIQVERNQREREQYGREKGMQDELQAAATPDPVMMKPETADNRDVGTDPTAAPTLQPGTTPLSPEEVQKRQIGVMQRYDPAKAMSMQASAMQLQAEKTKEANDSFDLGVNKAAAGGWDSLMDYMNKSQASPAQHRVIPNTEDGGKTVKVMTIMPDGSLKPTGQVYAADSSGVMAAAEMLTRGTPIAAKVAHALAEKREERALRSQENTDKYHQGMLRVAERQAATAENREKNQDERLAYEREKADGTLDNKLKDSEKMTLRELESKSQAINNQRVKLEADPSFDPESEDGQKRLKRLASMDRDLAVQKRAIITAAEGRQTTRDGARTARGPSASDPMGRNPQTMDGKPRVDLESPDAERARIYTDELAKVSPEDRPAMLREIAKLPPATRALVKGLPKENLPGANAPGAAPNPAAPATKAAIDPKDGRPMPAPENRRDMASVMGERGMLDTVTSAVGDFADKAIKTMRTEGAEYKGIEERVRAARRGGAALTPEETKLARKYGLV
jgi:hypothetical protein